MSIQEAPKSNSDAFPKMEVKPSEPAPFNPFGSGGDKPAFNPFGQGGSGFNPFGKAKSTDQLALIASESEEKEDSRPPPPPAPFTEILKAYVKPPEDAQYPQYENTPRPITPFAKFDTTIAAEKLAAFVVEHFGIQPSFVGSYSQKSMQSEVDMLNTVFNAAAVSEPNDNDDFLLTI